MKRLVMLLTLLVASCLSGFSQTQTKTVSVNILVFGIVTTSLPAATAGQAYSQTIIASGGKAPYSFSLATQTCSGSITSAGVLTTTQANAGSCSFSVKATDSSTIPLTQTVVFTLTVNSSTVIPLVITTPNGTTLSAVANSAYSFTVTATGGVPSSYNWTVLTGTIPTGMTLNAKTGVISGTPTAPTPDGGVPITLQLTSN